MHEYPVTQQIIRIADEYARKNNSSKVVEIDLVVGDYSGYMGECIKMYFDIIAEGTSCSDAALNIERVIPKLRCESCGTFFERKPFTFVCPVCGNEGVPTDIGHEFYVRSIVIQKNTGEEDEYGGEC